ncbi:hypothetical protein VTI28DRAFT_1028 [Corynascus sepedonium]
MTAIIQNVSLFLLPTFAVMVVTAPSGLDKSTLQPVHYRTLAEFSVTSTRDAPNSVCTNGTPASKQHPAGYPINNYTMVTPDAKNWTSYAVADHWYGKHFVSGPHILSLTHKSDPYGPFKCQFKCNAEDGCNAYFVWYDGIGTDHEHLNCVLFDAVVHPSVFVESSGTITSGVYDRLCSSSS